MVFKKAVFYFLYFFRSYYFKLLSNLKILFVVQPKPFSFIIPTIWKSENIHELVKNLNESTYVKEIILIDNGNKSGYGLAKFAKVKVINNITNQFVNPAWNQGVEHSICENIALCNDDIVLDIEHLKKISKFLELNYGLIGLHHQNFAKNKRPFSITYAPVRSNSYGALIFMKKRNYIKIPDNLKILCGDDFLFDNIMKTHFRVNGILNYAAKSVSSSIPVFQDQKNLDILNYNALKYQ